MITQFFINIGRNVLVWLAGLWPTIDIENLWGGWRDFVAAFAITKSLGVWIPWETIFLCISASLTSYAVLVIVKTVRATAAHIPAVGGSGD